MNFQTINPATGQLIQTYTYDTVSEGLSKLHELEKSFSSFRTYSIQQRVEFLFQLAQNLRDGSEDLSLQCTLEMGKTLAEARAEVEKCAQTAEFFAENLVDFLKPDQLSFHGQKNWVIKEPLGIIFAIMPWNFPYWQVIRFAVPAIGAGNVVLLKHSDITAGCAQKMADIFLKSLPDFPLLLNSHLDHESAAEIIRNPSVRGLTFTGSTRGGREVGALAGRYLKKSVLELGGSDPYLVFAEAQVDQAAQICARARMVNNGQSCVAAKRFIVHESVYDSFLEKFSFELQSYRLGSPLDSKSRVGPLAHQRFQGEVHRQVQELGLKNKITFGGQLPPGPGAFYPATLIEMTSNQDSAPEEIFGPVALVYKVKSNDQAIEFANQSLYGLGGAIFTQDIEDAKKYSLMLEAGFVAINDMVRSDPRIPFGGIKDSGYGRELSGYGLNEFCNLKTVTLKTTNS